MSKEAALPGLMESKGDWDLKAIAEGIGDPSNGLEIVEGGWALSAWAILRNSLPRSIPTKSVQVPRARRIGSIEETTIMI
jgi:hypothetical protein